MTTVLIIEDEQLIRSTLQDILELEGFDTLLAANGTVGIELAQARHPDIILCDIAMPGLSGYDVITELHQEPRTAAIPFIFLTAKADRTDWRHGMELGADDYLIKPFTPAEVLRSLRIRLKKKAAIAHPYTHQITNLQAQLDRLTYYDSLTQLPNRTALQERFSEIITSLQAGVVPILVVNLDQIARLSAALGRGFSNIFLKMVGERLQALPEVDHLAYLNDQQLAVMLRPTATCAEAEHVADVLQQSLLPAFYIDQHELFISASIGVSLYPQDGELLEDLLNYAAIATATVQCNGGDGICVYAPTLQAQVINRLDLETELRHALNRNQFQVYYQPQFNLQTQRLVGAEALLRWYHPDRGFISPAEFIPIAEETGLIVPIGEWVLRTVCAQAKAWHELHPALRVAVNLSARQFTHRHLLQTILSILAETELSPQCLELEITESMVMQDTQLALQILTALKAQGIQVAIDDFGVGYSSLGYLERFPFDTLKIDRCFVRDLAQNGRNQSIVSAIMRMAHEMNLHVVAEGIEQVSEVSFLQQLQCDTVQGYLYSPPVASQVFEQTLKTPQLEPLT